MAFSIAITPFSKIGEDRTRNFLIHSQERNSPWSTWASTASIQSIVSTPVVHELPTKFNKIKMERRLKYRLEILISC